MLPLTLVPKKVADHQCELDEFIVLLGERAEQLRSIPVLQEDFVTELERFLPPRVVAETISKPDFWSYLKELVRAECEAVQHSFKHPPSDPGFRM
jgi:hypothetical protein